MSSLVRELILSLIVAALTGLAIWAVTFARHSIRNSRIHKKYPLAGDYITYYEDEVDGQVTWVKAPICFKQHGKKVSGKMISALDNHESILDGEIIRDGYVSGVYYKTAVHDPGRGMFFMRPDIANPSNYRGVWSGYDSINEKITSGEYIWRKSTKPEILDINLKDEGNLNKALAILGSGLGTRYVDRTILLKYSENEPVSFILGAYVFGELAGVLLSNMMQEEEVEKFDSILKSEGNHFCLSLHRVGLLKAMAVKKEYRHKGIGSVLSKEAMSRLKALGCTVIFTVSWESQSSDSSQGLLESIGFNPLVEIKEYWRTESLENGFNCPRCGLPPCKCSATFYILEL